MEGAAASGRNAGCILHYLWDSCFFVTPLYLTLIIDIGVVCFYSIPTLFPESLIPPVSWYRHRGLWETFPWKLSVPLLVHFTEWLGGWYSFENQFDFMKICCKCLDLMFSFTVLSGFPLMYQWIKPVHVLLLVVFWYVMQPLLVSSIFIGLMERFNTWTGASFTVMCSKYH